MQDPWVSTYRATAEDVERNLKYWIMQGLHRLMEPWTMREAGGLIAVSEDYITTLRQRYPQLRDCPAKTLPFAATEVDFEVVEENDIPNRIFDPEADYVHGVYAGRAGPPMVPALRIIFRALSMGLRKAPEQFRSLRLHFVGTSYATDGQARKIVESVAEEFGVEKYVHEDPERVSYIEALQLLNDADFLVVPGSDDPQYTASKLYPYILSTRPILAVFHEQSSVVDILREVNAGEVLPFDPNDEQSWSDRFLDKWRDILLRIPMSPDTDWEAFEKYSAREMTRQQCTIFDRVVDRAVG